jgi:hypothetical protein
MIIEKLHRGSQSGEGSFGALIARHFKQGTLSATPSFRTPAVAIVAPMDASDI